MPQSFQYPTVSDFTSGANGSTLMPGVVNTLTITGSGFLPTACNVQVTDSNNDTYTPTPVSPEAGGTSGMIVVKITPNLLGVVAEAAPLPYPPGVKPGGPPKMDVAIPITVTVTVTNNPTTRPASNSKPKAMNLGN